MATFTLQMDSRELLRKLKKLNAGVEDKVVKKAVRKGANLIKREAKKNTPVDTGLMKSKVKVKAARGRYFKGFTLLVKVESPAHHLIELGTEDREPTKHKFLKFEGANGQMIYAKKVKGVKAEPFLGEAYESNKDDAIRAFNDELKRFIQANGL
ncbi:HK97-gp10 family putative phage morphogenesis protein [Echinicola sp. 20G]|uniref:HK97-gp10 family putative phage morphogenesis protein n=1 Tax=Echinicola sp. 20G TaxID=2781961 RepID=UPI001910AC33|nr:HK97-gp10 family putative phage morphogenesis protein [Echinicola sp. 20G]